MDDIERMRNLDPAADAEPPASLRERVAEISAADAPAVRRAPRWLTPVAAAAAVAVALGGGYLAGVRTGSAEPAGLTVAQGGTVVPVATGSAADPAAPVSLGGTSDSGAAALTAGGAQSESSAAFSAADSSQRVSPWHYSNGRRFAVPTLGDAATRATVYALDGRAQYSAADAERMAAALGVAGTAYQETPENGWTVGTDDWASTDPAFHLYPSGGGEVSYRSGAVDPHSGCWASIAPQYGYAEGKDLSEEQWQAIDTATQACVAATPMPTEQQARDALSTFLSATGVDESLTSVTVDVQEDARIISAVAARVVDGNATVVTSQVTVSEKGLLWANGQSAPVVSLGEYDIVSPSEAAARLNDPVFAPAYAVSTASEVDVDQYDPPATEPPAVPAPGAKVPWGITEFEISSARLGFALMTSIHDERFLAPAYEFTDTEGNVWSVLALAESEIDPVGGGDGSGWWGLY